MNKKLKMFLIASLTISAVLAGCNLQNNKSNSKSGSGTIVGQAISGGSIVVYIDKNCEKAGIQQCNPQIWKQQFSLILRGKGKFEVKYMDKKEEEYFKNLVGASPVLAIPENKLNLFGPQAPIIAKSGVKTGNVYFVPLFGWIPGEENLCNDGKDNNGDGKIDGQDPTCYKMLALTSKKCTLPYCEEKALKSIFLGYTVNVTDYNSTTGKKIYEELVKINKKQYLPTFLFNKKHLYLKKMNEFIKEINLTGYKYQLNIPQFKYDPKLEECEKNCNATPECKKLLTCNKSDKPVVELFVMSHCPFGTQAEKGIIPVIKLLGNKVRFYVRFVDYAMHGKEEIDENTLQYCIQKEEPQKYIPYLTCYLEKGDTQACKKKVKINEEKIKKCIEQADKKYEINKYASDKNTYVSGRFPQYKVEEDLNKKYHIQGSPTLVINGVVVQPQSRSPQAYLNAICQAFKNPPAECKKPLSNQSYDPGFGWTQSGKPAPAGSCGGK